MLETDAVDAVVTTAVSKRYGNRMAVDRVDLRVGRGQVFGLLGAYGAGQATLLRMLPHDATAPPGAPGSVFTRRVASAAAPTVSRAAAVVTAR